MARYLLKASDEEMDRWRAAAAGPLAPWLRRVANEAAVSRAALERRHALVVGREERHVPKGAVTEPFYGDSITFASPHAKSRSFTPDFGKRLKPDGGKR